jgi:hypothetical protein
LIALEIKPYQTAIAHTYFIPKLAKNLSTNKKKPTNQRKELPKEFPEAVDMNGRF